jgi:hypothetical protein
MENGEIRSSKNFFSFQEKKIFIDQILQGENQVDSFRTEAERRKAYSANSFDSLARQGTYHTGIYNVPRTTVKT